MVEFHPLSVIMKDYQSFGNSFCFVFFFFSFNSPILKYQNLIKIRHCLRFPFSIYQWHRNCGVRVFFFLQIFDYFLISRRIKKPCISLENYFSFNSYLSTEREKIPHINQYLQLKDIKNNFISFYVTLCQ